MARLPREAKTMTRREARWGAFTDAELHTIVDALRMQTGEWGSSPDYLTAMYGGEALDLPTQIAAELAKRGHPLPYQPVGGRGTICLGLPMPHRITARTARGPMSVAAASKRFLAKIPKPFRHARGVGRNVRIDGLFLRGGKNPGCACRLVPDEVKKQRNSAA